MTDVASRWRIDEHAAVPPLVTRSGDSAGRVSCVVLATALAASVPVARHVAGSEIYLFQVAVAALALIPLLLGQSAQPVGAAVWLACIPLVGLAAVASGPDSLRTGAPLMVMCAGAPFASRGLHVRGTAHHRFVMVAFITTQSVSAAVGVAQYFGARPFAITFLAGRPQGLAGHANALGLMAGIATLLLLNALLRGYGPRWLCAPALLLNVTALVASGSLTALGATVAAVCMLLWAQRRALVLALAFLALLSLGYALSTHVTVIGSLVDTVGYRSDVVLGRQGSGDTSVEERMWTYQYAIDYLRRSPLHGVGLQNDVAGTYDGVTVVHNLLLRGWFQGGITYALWLVTLLAMLMARVLVPAAARRSNELALPASGTLLILAFASTAAFLEQPQYWLPLIYFATMVDPTDAEAVRDPRAAATEPDPGGRLPSASSRRPQHRPDVSAVRRNDGAERDHVRQDGPQP